MKRTVLCKWHKKKAQMVPFAGYLMPVVYSSIKSESISVRKYGGVFDVSHMGKLVIKGNNFLEFADSVFPMDIKGAENYRALYGYLLNEQGGILDDLIVYKFPSYLLVIVNAVNTKKILNYLKSLQDNNISIEDWTDSFSIIAVQGPNAGASLSSVLEKDVSIKRFHFMEFVNKKYSFILARTGYTGEDGYEIIVQNLYAQTLWNDILESDKKLIPCGLGARDILRLEAGYPLYGHELNENVTPLEVGGEKFIYFHKNFIGKKALVGKKENINEVLTGFELDTKHIARQGEKVLFDNNIIGHITSGTYSFNLNRSIAMGFLSKRYVDEKGDIFITIQHKNGVSNGRIVGTFFLKNYKNN